MSNAVKSVTPAKSARKRNRKRKRRVASSSESSSSSLEDSSSSSGDERPTTVKLKTQVPNKPILVENSASSSESDSDSDSSEEESDHQRDDVEMLDASAPTEKSGKKERVVYSRSPSPSPPPVPSFLPTEPDGSVDTGSEKQLKDRFRKFWMQSVADAFQDDLAQIHKEPGMNKSRLAMLVDSLASGADVFASNSSPETCGVNEMDVVMNNPSH